MIIFKKFREQLGGGFVSVLAPAPCNIYTHILQEFRSSLLIPIVRHDTPSVCVCVYLYFMLCKKISFGSLKLEFRGPNTMSNFGL